MKFSSVSVARLKGFVLKFAEMIKYLSKPWKLSKFIKLLDELYFEMNILIDFLNTVKLGRNRP